MFAERCQSLLQCVHPELADLNLPSIMPPSSTASVTLDQLSTSNSVPEQPVKRRSNKLAAAVFVTTAAVAAGVFVTSRNSTRDPNTSATAVAAQPGANPSLLTVSGAATPLPSPPPQTAAPIVKTESLEDAPSPRVAETPAASSATPSTPPAVAAAPRRSWRPPPPRPAARPVPTTPARSAAGEPDVGF
jgi:hypothetical protein